MAGHNKKSRSGARSGVRPGQIVDNRPDIVELPYTMVRLPQHVYDKIVGLLRAAYALDDISARILREEGYDLGEVVLREIAGLEHLVEQPPPMVETDITDVSVPGFHQAPFPTPLSPPPTTTTVEAEISHPNFDDTTYEDQQRELDIIRENRQLDFGTAQNIVARAMAEQARQAKRLNRLSGHPSQLHVSFPDSVLRQTDLEYPIQPHLGRFGYLDTIGVGPERVADAERAMEEARRNARALREEVEGPDVVENDGFEADIMPIDPQLLHPPQDQLPQQEVSPFVYTFPPYMVDPPPPAPTPQFAFPWELEIGRPVAPHTSTVNAPGEVDFPFASPFGPAAPLGSQGAEDPRVVEEFQNEINLRRSTHRRSGGVFEVPTGLGFGGTPGNTATALGLRGAQNSQNASIAGGLLPGSKRTHDQLDTPMSGTASPAHRRQSDMSDLTSEFDPLPTPTPPGPFQVPDIQVTGPPMAPPGHQVYGQGQGQVHSPSLFQVPEIQVTGPPMPPPGHQVYGQVYSPGPASGQLQPPGRPQRCQRCRRQKKRCDRQRPCGRCVEAGIGYDDCLPGE